MLTIAIDAGHGMGSRTPGVNDPGAVAAGLHEAKMVYRLAESFVHVAREEYAGRVRITLTRDSMTEVAPLALRDEEAELEGAQNLISLHLNSGGGTGTETFYRDAADMRLARVAQDAAVAAFGLPNRGVKHESLTQHRRLSILNFDGPGCLVEVCFIDKPSDMAAVFADSARDARVAFVRGLLDGALELRG